MKKVCLVGCGTIGRLHAKNLVGKVELSFHSRTQASAEALSRQCGGGQVFASYAEVLDSAVDAVLISSPPDAHRPQVVAALTADKGVLVEKPLCATEDDLAAIGAAAAAHPDALLMIAENYYYKPFAQAAQVDHPAGFYRPSAAGDPWQALYAAGCGLEKRLWRAAGGRDPLRGPRSGPVRRRAPASDGRISRAPSGRARAELDSAGRIRIRGQAGVALCLERLQLDQGHLSARADCGDRGRIVFECNGLYARLRGRRKRLYFPGVGDLMGYGGMMRDFLQCLQEPGRQPYSDLARAERDLSIVFAAYKHIKD